MNGKDVEHHLRKATPSWAAYSLAFVVVSALIGGGFKQGRQDAHIEQLQAAERSGVPRSEARKRLRKLETGQGKLETGQDGIKRDVQDNKDSLRRIERKQEDGNKKLDQLKDLLIRRPAR